MTLDLILQAVEDALRPLISAARGKLSVADTELDAYDMLNLTADGWRVVMTPGGGDSGEEGDTGGYVTDVIQCFLQVPRPGDVTVSRGMHRDVSARGVNFMARLGWLKKQVRSIVIDHEQIDRECGRVLRFVDWDWVRVDGIPATIRAARVRFQVRYILDEPDDEITTVTAASGLRLQIVGNYLHVTSADGVTTKRLRLLDLA